MNQAPGITVGNAAKIAADLVGTHVTSGIDLDTVIGLWISTLDTVIEVTVGHQSDAPTATPPKPALPTLPAPAAAPAAPVFNAEQSITQAFPGTQVQTTPGQVQLVAPPAAAAAAAPAPAPAPAAIPGASAGGEDPELVEAWGVFFEDLERGTFANNWEDNRSLKAQGGKYAKIPDFKHKTWKRPGSKWPVGLYISDKKNPQWVAQRLGAAGVV
jgi:hypothetical protein